MTFIKSNIVIAAIAVGVFGAHDVYGDEFGVNPQGSYFLSIPHRKVVWPISWSHRWF
jgi:hypothetical protein